ncbi:hypothetical protein F8C82_01670 [Phaeocystidibacter marisrubri]|uniref:Methylmalonyl-CoA mutase alpha/beta chain catalytic domain-containing protein n=2 Tax=Phaeocystidibacter marisrubri TaxID=1577780 RepID=A0A6L3ZIZ0_9FLAO|nr:hypothetical protein F8C82_01670 [Phaeocystidibacter marisrubri]
MQTNEACLSNCYTLPLRQITKSRFMSNSSLTFQEFPAASKAEWIAKIEKELKGGNFEDLFTHYGGDITLSPTYHSEDLPSAAAVPTRTSKIVDTIEGIYVDDASEGNKAILDVLNKGCSGVMLYLKKGVQLAPLLADVLIEHITVHYVSNGEASNVQSQLLDIITERGLNPAEIRGSINVDPIENLARTGEWFSSEESDFNTLESLINSPLKSMNNLAVNANIYHNAGASAATELGLTLAHAHEFIGRWGSSAFSHTTFNMAIGKSYLLEVAKFRALRSLWAKVGEAYETEAAAHIYAETGLRNKTIFDPNVNMLRTTTEAMSALIGGVDEVCVQPYDITFRESTPQARRVARNQALVMQYEAFVTKVNDPAAGSYAIENLTNDLCEEAWKVFREIEAKGGMIEALKSGFVQELIEREAAIEQELYNEGKIILVGTNKFPNAAEKMSKEATTPLFASDNSEGKVIRKIVARRLSEAEEQTRLKAE